jgi:hypothetical protein
MVAWWIGFFGVVAAILVIALRRPTKRSDGEIGHDLVEGLLPSALTGSTQSAPKQDGWELRWADVTKVTGTGTAGSPAFARAPTPGGPLEGEPPGAQGSAGRPAEDPAMPSAS